MKVETQGRNPNSTAAVNRLLHNLQHISFVLEFLANFLHLTRKSIYYMQRDRDGEREREILSIAKYNYSPHPSLHGPDVGDMKKLHELYPTSSILSLDEN
jgi:hypothetical protein